MRTVVRVLASVLCALTLAGSVYGLWHVCIDLAKMPDLIAVAVIAGFDGSALVFGLKVAQNPKEAGAWAGVVLCAALSSVAQILAAPPEAGPWRLLHGAPAVTAIWTLHNAVKQDEPSKKKPKPKKTPKDRSAGNEAGAPSVTPPASPPPPAVTGVRAEPGAPNPVVALDSARRKGPRRAPGRVAAPLSEADRRLVDAAVNALLDRGEGATRRRVEEYAGVGNRVAGRLLPFVTADLEAAQQERQAEGRS